MTVNYISLIALNKIHEKHDNSVHELSNGFQLHVSEDNSWTGIRLISKFLIDDVYIVKINANAENDNSLLEIILPTENGEIRISSFVINHEAREYQFVFSPLLNSDSLSFRMSTFGGYASGKINVKDIKISNLFPVSDRSDLIDKIRILGPWFHQLDLNSVKTRNISKTDSPTIPEGFTSTFTEQDHINNPIWIWSKFKHIINIDLAGKQILDIACNCGFYSLELAKRGATVTGIDNSYQDIVRAKFAKKVLGIKNVDFQFIDVKDLEKRFKKKFDLVLCLGLLYHLEKPDDVINTISKIADTVIFETIIDFRDIDIENIEEHKKTTDGYVPTVNWLRKSFAQAGFREVIRITPPNSGRTVFLCQK